MSHAPPPNARIYDRPGKKRPSPLMLLVIAKEEVHVSRIQRTVNEPRKVVLRTESVTAERVEPAVKESASERTGRH